MSVLSILLALTYIWAYAFTETLLIEQICARCQPLGPFVGRPMLVLYGIAFVTAAEFESFILLATVTDCWNSYVSSYLRSKLTNGNIVNKSVYKTVLGSNIRRVAF